MKVITPGVSDNAWPKVTTCTGVGNGGKGCGAKLLVELTDIFTTEGFELEGAGEIYYAFQCPCCNGFTDLSNFQPPRNVQFVDFHTWNRNKTK